MGENLPPLWLRLLPSTLRAKIKHRPNLLQALSNTGWLFGDKVLRMGIGLLVGVWIARYLGPEQFGLLNYAVAVVALFGAVASVGLNGIVVRDLLNQPEAASDTLGSSFVLQLLGGFVAFGLAVLTINLLRPEETLVKLIVALLGFTLVFKASDVARYWFESQVQSRYVVWVENGVFFVLVVFKIALVLSGAPLMTFVWATFAEALLVAVGLLVVYARRGGQIAAWHTSANRIKSLLADSWPLILSGLAVMIYMRIDQIMLGQMLGNKEVGIYSAAVRLSEVFYFLPMVVASSVFPAIIRAKASNEIDYHRKLQFLYDGMMVLGLLISITMTVLAEPIVSLTFGDKYSVSAYVLAIHVWASIFAFLGAACGLYTQAENIAPYSLYQTLLGLAVNILLNYIWIPQHGVTGAAWATLVSSAAATMSILFFARTRTNGMLVLRALCLLWIIPIMRKALTGRES